MCSAIKKLCATVEKAPSDLSDALELMIEAYCFRTIPIDRMSFVQSKLVRTIERAKEKHASMKTLLGFAWWEDLFGFVSRFGHRLDAIALAVDLYGHLLNDLCAMHAAMAADPCRWIHVELMKQLHLEISAVEQQLVSLYHYLASQSLRYPPYIDPTASDQASAALNALLQSYRLTYRQLLIQRVQMPLEIEHSMPTSMYLQAFQHFGGLITKFAAQYNSTVWRPRPTFQEWLKERVRTNCRHFLDRSKYPKQNILFAIRISASIVMGIWVSAYSMNYSSKTPFVVGLAAQLHLGGTFNRTIWRTMGVVIGCAIPAVLQYYICTTIPEEGIALATRVTLGIFFNSLVLMSVVTCTKYIFFSGFSLLTGKIGSYSCVTVMVHSDGYGGLSCPSTLPANAQAIMYGSFTETLVGLAIVLVMEIAFQPQSARGMLERSVSNLLRSVAAAFDDLFQHHLSGDRSVDEGGVYFALSERRLEKLRVEVTKTLPALVDKIKLLLKDAELEPSLWKPAFSRVKYQEVTRICEDLLWRVRLLVDLVDWTTPTVTPVISTSASTTESPALSPTADFRGATLELSSFHLMWVQAQDQFKRYAFGTMDTLCALFGGEIAHAVDAEKCAVYMQLKEAFRRADVTRRTKINVDELANLLSSLVPQRVILGTFGETSQTAPSATPETRTLAQQLMELGDRDHDGFLDCREFVDVLDRYSCRLEFQPRPGSWAAAVAATAEADDAAPHSPQQAIPLMDEDLLYVESFTIDEAAVEFRRAYSELVYVYVSRLSDPHQLRKSRSTASGTTNNPQNLTTKQVQRIMHMSSLICATDCIAQSLARLNTVAVSSL